MKIDKMREVDIQAMPLQPNFIKKQTAYMIYDFINDSLSVEENISDLEILLIAAKDLDFKNLAFKINSKIAALEESFDDKFPNIL